MKNTIFFQALPSLHLHHHPTNIYAILRTSHSWKFTKNSAHFPKKNLHGVRSYISVLLSIFCDAFFLPLTKKTQSNGARHSGARHVNKHIKINCLWKTLPKCTFKLAGESCKKNTQIYRVRFPHELWSIFPSFARLQGDGKFPRAPSGRFIKLCIFCVINFDWS